MIPAQALSITVTRRARVGVFLLGLLACSLVVVIDAQTTHAATITVINRDGAGEGFNDPTSVAPVGGNFGTTLGAQRLNAFQFAANLWGALLSSPVEIRVGANFDPQFCNASSAILGSAGPANIARDFVGAPIANTWFPIALASALHGSDLNLGGDDITATFNSAIGTTCAFPLPWYYGLDAAPPGGQIDFVTVVVHELGHGLGFLTLVDLGTGAKLGGLDDVYMRNLENHLTGKLYPNMTDAERLAANTSTGNLHWVGPQVRAASGVLTSGRVGDHVQMFAPNPAQQGSSVSHFDTALSPNESMEPIYTGPLHTPGLALPLFQDIGWSTGATPVTLSVTKAGTGTGTVTSSPGGINCGATCSASFSSGTIVTLTAAPAGGSTFTGWSGACTGTGTTCTVTLNAAATVTATFTASTTFTLSVTKTGTGSGTVISSPGGINCGAACSATFNNGTVVTLTATAATGVFAGWSGPCSGTGTCTIATNVATTVTATFNIPASITASPASVAPGGTVTATWSSIASPSPLDWIGLYSPASANTAFLAWIYVSCSRTATTAKASGSCPFVLPNPLASGTYELRLFANNGFTRLATSNAFSVTAASNSAPGIPSPLGQFRSDGVTAIAVGATTPDTSVVLKGVLSDPDAGQTVKLQLEVRPLGTAFSNAATHESALLASGSLAAVTVPSLTPGTSYHWQARAVDSQGAASAWTPFGANAESAADFAVGSSSTTLSVSPTSAAPGGSVTATWSGIANPSPLDWIGLYSPGSANTTFLAWIYVSCSRTATTAKASGSCPFALPTPLASGTYELRLLANNAFASLATSNAFSVSSATNTAPAAPTTLGQFRSDAVTTIAVGDTTPETSVVFKGVLSDPDAGQTVKLQLEVRPLTTAFSDTATHESALLASGSLAAVTVPSLTPGTSYHWQARAVDDQGAASSWTPFGANAETVADFAVASSSTILSVLPTSAAPGSSVTATWSGIATPTPLDWIGLYAAGGPDTAFLGWTYLSCSKATTAVRASGSCPFALPNPLTSGTYELRLFANNGFSRLATSDPLTVP